MSGKMHSLVTQYGFEYGAAKIQRIASDKGYAFLTISTPRQTVDIVVTPSGLIRIGSPTPLARAIKLLKTSHNA
jgi:hypothetical protein